MNNNDKKLNIEDITKVSKDVMYVISTHLNILETENKINDFEEKAGIILSVLGSLKINFLKEFFCKHQAIEMINMINNKNLKSIEEMEDE